MEKIRLRSDEIAELVSIERRSVNSTVKKYIEILKGFGDVIITKENPYKEKGGRPREIYTFTSEKQILFIASRMNRKADVSKLSKYINGSVYVYSRMENEFYILLESIIKGFQNNLIICKDVLIGKNRIDYVIYRDNDTIENILFLVEYDEIYHKYNKEKDSSRLKDISNYLFKNTEYYGDRYCLYAVRIKEGEESEGVENIIKMLNYPQFNLEPSTIEFDNTIIKEYSDD